jgi:hypothetical protein
VVRVFFVAFATTSLNSGLVYRCAIKPANFFAVKYYFSSPTRYAIMFSGREFLGTDMLTFHTPRLRPAQLAEGDGGNQKLSGNGL